MIRPAESDLRDFYHTPLGAVVCRRLRRRICYFWSDICGETRQMTESAKQQRVLGVGYVTPYLLPFLQKTCRGNDVVAQPLAVTPFQDGVQRWPSHGANSVTTSLEEQLPFTDDMFDRVLLVHSLEHSDAPQQLLEEAWRILKPHGKILIVVPNRLSIWARVEATPFGNGHPYSFGQLERLMNKHKFKIKAHEVALFLPPSQSRFILKTSDYLRRGLRLFSSFGGVLIIEAEKQLYAPTQSGTKAPVVSMKEVVSSSLRSSRSHNHDSSCSSDNSCD